MSEVIGWSVRLDGQLQLGDDFVVDGDFESDVTDGHGVGESALDFDYFISFLLVSFDEVFDLIDGENDIIDICEDTFASDHIADFEDYLIFGLQNLIYSFFVLCILCI